MLRRESSFEIESAAVAWVARMDRGPLSPQDQAELEVWLTGDGRRLGAFMRARALALHTMRAHALGGSYNPNDFRVADLSRRKLWVGGAALGLAAATAGAVVLPPLLPSLFDQRFDTRVGEVRLIALQDGSTLTLNTNSHVEVRFTKRRRSIRLLDGEALFDVAKDPARPFVVATDTATVRAVGTSFTVRRLKTGVQVLVREGVVEMERVAAPNLNPVKISANMRATVDRGDPIATQIMLPTEVGRQMAWRSGMIAFDGMTLAEAAIQFSRYSETRIVIDDPDLAAKTVTGLYSASDPIGFARAVADSFDVQIEVTGDSVRLKR